jgi:hypothetical protein
VNGMKSARTKIATNSYEKKMHNAFDSNDSYSKKTLDCFSNDLTKVNFVFLVVAVVYF